MSAQPIIHRDARLSPCGRYRWRLSRRWDETGKLSPLGWLMLNPSTADAHVDDATIRVCMRFAIRWGYGGIEVANLFPLRATDPKELYATVAPLGPEPHRADEAIFSLWETCPVVVAGWGIHGVHRDRAADVCVKLGNRGLKLHCLGTTGTGQPRHPLYLPGDSKLVEFTGRGA